LICGHHDCGAVKAVIAGTPVGIPAIDTWLAPLLALSKKYYYSWINFSDAGKPIGLARINVQNNLALLKANPLIVANPQIAIHGALYDVVTGSINFLSGNDLMLPPL